MRLYGTIPHQLCATFNANSEEHGQQEQYK